MEGIPEMKKVIVIAGPTAAGKSDFAVEAAKRLNGEIISGDSVQVYRGMDIGSGKVTAEEMQGIKHHLIDIKDPKEKYSVSDFQTMARDLIAKIDTPIIAGGTGLYLKAVLYDYAFESENEESSVDADLEQYTNEELFAMLEKVDPVQCTKLHPNNRRRVMRSLTIYRRSGKPQSELEKEQSHTMVYDVFTAGCTMDRAVLYERINLRVEKMFAAGLQNEVENLLKQGYTFEDPGMQGIGYKEWKDFFYGDKTTEEIKEEIQKNSRHYAKRQYTWLNHQMDVQWFDVLGSHEEILDKIERWYHEQH